MLFASFPRGLLAGLLGNGVEDGLGFHVSVHIKEVAQTFAVVKTIAAVMAKPYIGASLRRVCQVF